MIPRGVPELVYLHDDFNLQEVQARAGEIHKNLILSANSTRENQLEDLAPELA